jgi:uncharacterized BrkB/YihY/UPF0761 family membrane protein
METILDPSRSQPSLFITVAAWVFIVLSGLSTVFAVMENIMLYFVFSPAMMQKMAEAHYQNMPPVPTFMFTGIRLIMFVALLLSFFALAASIGLLKRKNWARRSMIALLVIAILWTVGGLLMQAAMFFVPAFHSQAANEFQTGFMTMWRMMLTFSIVTTTGLSILFGWLIKRLVSPAVRREFVKA